MFEWHRHDSKHFDRGHRVDGFSFYIFHAVSATRITITRVNLAFVKWVLFTWLRSTHPHSVVCRKKELWMQMQIHEKSNCCQLRWLEYFFCIEFRTTKIWRRKKSRNTLPSFVTRVERALSTMTCMEKRRLWENAYAKLRSARLDAASTRDGQQSADPPHILVFSSPRNRLTRRFTSLFFSWFEKDTSLTDFFFLHRIPWSMFIRVYDSM